MADYQAQLSQFDALDTRVIAASADSREDAARLAERLGIRFTLGYGIDPHALARAIGCYEGRGERHEIVQPASFVAGMAAARSSAVSSPA